MFETKKTLIVVYKDELLMNQLKKMVETHDDNDESVVGTRDDSINIVSWTEKVWNGNKKAGNIQGKILFLGDIKGTDKLIPVIDVKFDDCGVKYGWAGNQAVLFVDPKTLTDRKSYDDFLQKLSELPVPSFLKTMKDGILFFNTDNKISERACRVDYLIVSKKHRKAGVGRALFYNYVEWCGHNGINNVYIWPDGETPKRIYEEGGYRVVEIRKAGRAVLGEQQG